MGSLDGKVAFITGGARGQGRSHAVRLAEEGADIVVVDVDMQLDTVFYPMSTAADLDTTVKLVEEQGRRVVSRLADVRDQSAMDAAVADAVEELGYIDIVAANAGISVNMAKTWETTPEAWDDMIDVNLRGVWHTAKAVIPSMIAAGRGGSMVFTSSLAGLEGYRHLGAYTAAKHGVNGLMRTLANELAEHNIRVNSVCPGSTDTEMMCNPVTYKLFRPDLANPTKDDAREVVRAHQLLPMDLVESRDISEVVLWLASDASRYVTGLAIPVDGGRMAKT